eukprot:5248100-Pleurochrysis_carterae.AAC.1
MPSSIYTGVASARPWASLVWAALRRLGVVAEHECWRGGYLLLRRPQRTTAAKHLDESGFDV